MLLKVKLKNKSFLRSIYTYSGSLQNADFTIAEYELLGYSSKFELQNDEFFNNYADYYTGNDANENNLGIGKGLNDADIFNLIEYAYIFDAWEKEEHIKVRHMLKLALMLSRFRYLQSRDTILWKLNPKKRQKLSKNYTQQEKAKIVQKKVKKLKEQVEKAQKLSNEIINLMGGNTVRYENITDEYLKLNSIKINELQNPEYYIPRNKLKIAMPIKEIKDFLISLKLPKMYDHINNFIHDIQNTEIITP